MVVGNRRGVINTGSVAEGGVEIEKRGMERFASNRIP